MLVITHDEFADRAVDRLAVAQTGVIRFRNRAPTPMLLEDGKQMIVVADGLQIHDQRLVIMNSQRGGGEEGALGAMRQSVTQHTTRRTTGLAAYFFVIPDVVIEKVLNLLGAGQPLDNREFPPLQSKVHIHTLIVPAPSARRQNVIFKMCL